MEETFKLAKEGIEIVNKDKINKLNYMLNEKAEEFKKKIDKDINNLFNEILKSNNIYVIDFFESTKLDFINSFKNIFSFEEENNNQNVEDFSSKIIKIIEFIIKEKIEDNINNLKYDYIVDYLDLSSRYNEKKQPKDNLNTFKKKVYDNIIYPIFYCRKVYAMMEIYNIVLNEILSNLYEKYSDSLSSYKKKIVQLFLKISDDNYNNFVKSTNINQFFN